MQANHTMIRVRTSTRQYIKSEAAKRGVNMDVFLDEVISAFKHCESKAFADIKKLDGAE
jgi:hypothetical protein